MRVNNNGIKKLKERGVKKLFHINLVYFTLKFMLFVYAWNFSPS